MQTKINFDISKLKTALASKITKKTAKVAVVLVVLTAIIGTFYWQTTLAKTQALNSSEENWGIADAKEEDIYAKISGRVTKIYVQEGDYVEKGQIIAEIDNDMQQTDKTQAEAALRAQYAQVQQAIINSQTDVGTLNANLSAAQAKAKQAQAALDLAIKNEQRYAQLLAQGATSQQEYDTMSTAKDNAQATYDAALAQVDAANAALNKNAANQQLINAQQQQADALQGKIDAVNVSEKETKIRAPFSGIITKKYIEEGAVIAPTVPLFSLQDSTNNWINFNIKETDLTKYHLGDTVELQGRNDELKLTGTIENISRKPDYATIKATNERGDKDIVTFDVKVRTNNNNIWPGMRFKLLN